MLRLSVLLAFVLAPFVARTATASVTVAYDLPTLVARSEHVVSGRVIDATSRYDGTRIVTDLAIEVDGIGKGRARHGETLPVVVLGGSVDGVTMRVEGGVRMRPDDEAVFFLERHESGALIPSGLSQGVMPIRAETGRRLAMPGGHGLVLMARDPDGRVRRGGPAIEAPEEVDSLLRRVRAMASGGGR